MSTPERPTFPSPKAPPTPRATGQHKSALVALILSFLVPGAGHFYVGRTLLGVVILVCWLVALLLSFVVIGIPFLVGFWLFGMVHSAIVADRTPA